MKDYSNIRLFLMSTKLNILVNRVRGTGVRSRDVTPIIVTSKSGTLTSSTAGDIFVAIFKSKWNRFRILWLTLANTGNELDPNSYIQSNYYNISAGTTLLSLASSHGGSMFVNFLIQKGANVDWHPIPSSIRPLTGAIIQNKDAVAELLIRQYHAQINYGDHGYSPLGLAALMANLRVVQLLVEGGANPNWMSLSHHVPQLPLVLSPSHRISGWLLENSGARINKVDYRNNTPLSDAVQRYIQFSTVFFRDLGGLLHLSPLHSTVKSKRLHSSFRRVMFYLQWGANPDVGIVHLPLLQAVTSGDYELTALLLRWGAHPKQKGYLIGFIPYVAKTSIGTPYVAFRITRRWVDPLSWIQEKKARDDIPDVLLDNPRVSDNDRKLLLRIKRHQAQADKLENLLMSYQRLWEVDVNELSTINSQVANARLRRIALASGILTYRHNVSAEGCREEPHIFYSLPQDEILTSPQTQRVLEYIQYNKSKLWSAITVTADKPCGFSKCENTSEIEHLDQTTVFSLNEPRGDTCHDQSKVFQLLFTDQFTPETRRQLNAWWDPHFPATGKCIDQATPLPLKSNWDVLVEELSRIVWEINTNINIKRWADRLSIEVWKALAKSFAVFTGQGFTTREEWGTFVMGYLVTEATTLRISPQNVSIIVEKSASRYENTYRNKAIGIIRTDNVQSVLYSQAEEFSRLARMFKSSTRSSRFLQRKQSETDNLVRKLSVLPVSLTNYIRVAQNNQELIRRTQTQITLLQFRQKTLPDEENFSRKNIELEVRQQNAKEERLRQIAVFQQKIASRGKIGPIPR